MGKSQDRRLPIPIPRGQQGGGGVRALASHLTEGRGSDQAQVEPCSLVGLVLTCNQCGATGMVSVGAPLFCRCGRVYRPSGDITAPIDILQGEPLVKPPTPAAPRPGPLDPPPGEGLLLPPSGLILPSDLVGR